VGGAVYSPLDETAPQPADQRTPLLFVPETVAVNCLVCIVSSDADVGDIDIEIAGLTVTVAEADLEVLARLVAVTEQLPGDGGGVYRPVEETVPQLAVQETEVSGAPVTVAENW
jgi:hypothetical protein